MERFQNHLCLVPQETHEGNGDHPNIEPLNQSRSCSPPSLHLSASECKQAASLLRREVRDLKRLVGQWAEYTMMPMFDLIDVPLLPAGGGEAMLQKMAYDLKLKKAEMQVGEGSEERRRLG